VLPAVPLAAAALLSGLTPAACSAANCSSCTLRLPAAATRQYLLLHSKRCCSYRPVLLQVPTTSCSCCSCQQLHNCCSSCSLSLPFPSPPPLLLLLLVCAATNCCSSCSLSLPPLLPLLLLLLVCAKGSGGH
jgi:hypothetical protein